MTDFVGYRTLTVSDPELHLNFPVAVLYPSSTPGQLEQVGPYTLEIAREAPVKAAVFPLVLVSHGTGGSGLVYRTLAHYLARHGFVVALPEHPFNNRDNDTWAGTSRNLEARPRHLQLAIEALFANECLAPFLKPATVGIIGHSAGGYTALALAGGVATSFPVNEPDGQPRQLVTPVDSRIKALVLLAPATPWFVAEGSLQRVTAPILLLTAEKDEHTPPEHALIVLHRVPDLGRVQHRVVPNAGHYSFLSPFPPTRVSPTFPPSQDPPGFDRTRFHEELNAEVRTFLQEHL